jgi:hypothetical protein
MGMRALGGQTISKIHRIYQGAERLLSIQDILRSILFDHVWWRIRLVDKDKYATRGWLEATNPLRCQACYILS